MNGNGRNWTRISGGAALPPGGLRQIVVGEQVWVLANHGGEFYALGGRCTHKPDALLAEGLLSEGTIMCPWHGYRYDVRTGRNVHPESARPISCVPVQVDGDDLLLDLGDGPGAFH